MANTTMAFLIYLQALLLAIGCMFAPRSAAAEPELGQLTFAADKDNDLYRAVFESLDGELGRYDTALEAVNAAAKGGGVVIVADGYPTKPLVVIDEVFAIAKRKGLKLYIEFPATGTAGLKLDGPEENSLKRLVVNREGVLAGLEEMQILDAHECVHTPVTQEIKPERIDLMLARVAGYNTAVFGFTGQANPTPALFTHVDPKSGQEVLVSTIGMSHFIRGRFAPNEHWKLLWQAVLSELMPGDTPVELDWTPLTRPMYAQDEELPKDARKKAVQRGIQWYSNARQLVHPDWVNIYDDRSRYGDSRVHQAWPDRDLPLGDGTLGILEGTANPMYPDGAQAIRWLIRGDCVGEAAMAYALHGRLTDNSQSKAIAENLITYMHDSPLASGVKSDPSSNVYGLRAWNASTNPLTYYSDDIARLQIGQIGAISALDTDKWDHVMATQILAVFRLTGTNGFWGSMRYDGTLADKDWRDFYNATPNPAARSHPHYEAYKLVPMLWLYGQTGHEPLLERPRAALGHMVQALKEGRIHWTNGLQQERARLILPLAWLVRADDTAEHREWLEYVVGEVLKNQQPSGGIVEEVGGQGGQFPPPSSNGAFGTSEAPVIQENGDPGVDLLYTTNFAFKGLIEAEAVLNEPEVTQALEKLADFLVRIQVKSQIPELDGQWLRGFDFEKWDYWGSDSDLGWGIWGNQLGWTQSEIVAGLALVELDTSLWDLASQSKIEEVFPEVKRLMLAPLEDQK